MQRVLRGWLFFLLLVSVLGLVGGAWVFADLPGLDVLPEHLNMPSVRITDRDDRLLYDVLPEQGGRHAVIPLECIPLTMQQATIATEDENFYSNPGVDWVGVLRAIWINVQGGDAASGGSTITQQVARNLLMEQGERSQRSLRRKLREWALAWRLTHSLSKSEILALYLNQTYYGGMAYGVEAAAQTYFGKPVEQLDLAESALLAGLPQAPALYNPFTDFEAAQKRQQVVLRLMREAGYISVEQQELAGRERLIFAETPYPIEAPHFVMLARAELDRLFTAEDVYAHGGLVVRTTLNLDWQRHAERAVARQLEDLQRSRDGLGHNVNSAALAAVDSHTGDILALVGSPDFFDAQHAGAINMALAARQPGSALKPLVYAAALDPQQPGSPWTAATMFLDVRTSFTIRDHQAYVPENYDLRQHGPVLLREALASSLNIPAVMTLEHIGLKSLFDLAGRLGITTLKDPGQYDLSVALGGGEVRLLELTAAYGAFANGGYAVAPRSILAVSDLQGNELYRAPDVLQRRVLDERVVWLISDILSDNNARRLGFGANSILRLDRPAAVKTGTTSNFHDNWTVGYTPNLVVGVWSGNTNYEAMHGVNGLSGAAPIWHQFMRAVLSEQPTQAFIQPPGLTYVEVCALSGLLPTPACAYRRWEWFIEGTQPVKEDVFYRMATVDALTGRLTDEQTPPERRVERVTLDLPMQAQPWARSQGLTLYSDLLESSAAGLAAKQEAQPSRAFEALQMIAPASGSVFIFSSTAAPNMQRIRLEAVAASDVQQVTLWIDGQQAARFTEGPYQAWWTLQVGEHRAWAEARLADGRTITSQVVSFVVR